jgi:DNA polymerase alpha subunit A
MYGCLGFSNSRFFAQPIAAMITSMGRQTLQRTVDIAQSTLGLDVVYGDTDSIMINTRITDKNSLKTVRELGEQVKREVNKLYRTLELEIDGIFQCLLLLKKKKYAAIVVEEGANGQIEYKREEKGLDLVRRDWCIQSKDTGRYILDQILSSEDKEAVVANILNHLEDLAKKMRNGELPIDKYVITKGLSRHPNDYPDAKSQPHVHVARAMIQNSRSVSVGDHIPYIITAPLEGVDDASKASKSMAERARHPEEVARSGGILKPDVEWYLTQQILPPVARLCEPIEGTPQGLLAERLGLDTTRYNRQNSSSGIGAEIDDDALVSYTPASCMTDKERFRDVTKLNLTCVACGETNEFPGALYTIRKLLQEV